MALTQGRSTTGATSGDRKGPRAWIDLGAPLVVWLYVFARFEPLTTLIVLPGAVSGALLPALGVGVLLMTPPERIGLIPISLPLMSLTAWMGLTVYWSELPGFTEYLIRSELVPLVVLAAVVGTMPPRRVVRTLMAIVLTIGLITLASSVLLAAGRQTVIDGVDQLGFRGWFIHKNVMGVFMVAALCLVLPFARGRGRPFVIALFVGLILATRSATAAGGLLGVLFVWGCMTVTASQRTQREKQFVLVLSVASAIAGGMLVLGLLPALLGLYDKDVTFSGRTDIWSESIVTISERPVQGYGLGGVWSDDAAPVTVELRQRITFDAAHAHNSALEILLEGGVIGLALTAVFLVQVVGVSVACLRQPAVAAYGRWGLLTVLALFLMGLAEPLFQGPHLGLLMVVWVTLTRARNDAGRAGTWLPPWSRD